MFDVHHSISFVGYAPEVEDNLRKIIDKAHTEEYVGNPKLDWTSFPNEQDAVSDGFCVSSDGVILFPRVIKSEHDSSDFELIRRAKGDLSIVCGDYARLFNDIARRRAETNAPTLIMFNAVCFDEMHASEYEDWQGERDRQVHNFPWCKTFCYMSTSFENQFRENR
ncbi:MAG: hypothetical protein AABX66_04400, partial [Nanoarchaeota archaeon]